MTSPVWTAKGSPVERLRRRALLLGMVGAAGAARAFDRLAVACSTAAARDALRSVPSGRPVALVEVAEDRDGVRLSGRLLGVVPDGLAQGRADLQLTHRPTSPPAKRNERCRILPVFPEEDR